MLLMRAVFLAARNGWGDVRTEQARIASGELRSGARLRSERDLAAHYGVAYHTVRRAREVLRSRDLVVSVHGRGTYVR